MTQDWKDNGQLEEIVRFINAGITGSFYIQVRPGGQHRSAGKAFSVLFDGLDSAIGDLTTTMESKN